MSFSSHRNDCMLQQYMHMLLSSFLTLNLPLSTLLWVIRLNNHFYVAPSTRSPSTCCLRACLTTRASQPRRQRLSRSQQMLHLEGAEAAPPLKILQQHRAVIVAVAQLKAVPAIILLAPMSGAATLSSSSRLWTTLCSVG